jgi:hypothetical protein
MPPAVVSERERRSVEKYELYERFQTHRQRGKLAP